jgi:hypothetical protein
VAFAATEILPCQQPPASSGHASAQQGAPPQAKMRPSSAGEESCKAFVQNFYDWYWNRFADQADRLWFDPKKEPNVWTVLERKPNLLGPELRRLLTREDKQTRATHEIGNLGFDPFFGNQDPQGKYLVGGVIVRGDRCDAGIVGQHVIPQLEKSGSTWVFVNFRYSFYSEDGKTKEFPDDDLVHILSR